MAIDKHGEYMDLTLEEMESGIVLIKGFIEDLQHSVMGYMVTSHPDYDSINGILNNLRLLVAEYKRDLYEDFVNTTYGHGHKTNDWSPTL
jgi:hypothetical protein